MTTLLYLISCLLRVRRSQPSRWLDKVAYRELGSVSLEWRLNHLRESR